MQAIDKFSFPEAQNDSIFVNVCGCLKALYRSSPNLDDECDVQIWLWTTIVDHLVSHGRHSWNVKSDQLRLCLGGILNYTWGKTIKSDHVWGKSWTMFGGKSSKVTNWDYVRGNPELSKVTNWNYVWGKLTKRQLQIKTLVVKSWQRCDRFDSGEVELLMCTRCEGGEGAKLPSATLQGKN